jgi:hypothetical protein
LKDKLLNFEWFFQEKDKKITSLNDQLIKAKKKINNLNHQRKNQSIEKKTLFLENKRKRDLIDPPNQETNQFVSFGRQTNNIFFECEEESGITNEGKPRSWKEKVQEISGLV